MPQYPFNNELILRANNILDTSYYISGKNKPNSNSNFHRAYISYNFGSTATSTIIDSAQYNPPAPVSSSAWPKPSTPPPSRPPTKHLYSVYPTQLLGSLRNSRPPFSKYRSSLSPYTHMMQYNIGVSASIRRFAAGSTHVDIHVYIYARRAREYITRWFLLGRARAQTRPPRVTIVRN